MAVKRKEPAGNGVPVTVTCRVFKLARRPSYRWLGKPVAQAVLEEAYRANALFDARCGDPEFNHRFLADEARGAGPGWRTGRPRGGSAGTPLVERVRGGARREQEGPVCQCMTIS